MESINCNICCSDKYKVFNEINGYRLVKCGKCGLVYLNPRPTQQESDEKYSAKYHTEKILKQEPKTDREIENEINKSSGIAQGIVKRFGKKGKLLDIGCGAGFFIASLKRLGWNVRGIDISEWASNFAREKLGLDVSTGILEKTRIDEQFDVVTMHHILEHLPNPLETLKKVSELVLDDGYLVIKGPNLASFDRIWYGKNWRGYDVPFHLYDFTPKTYSMLLEKAGFSVKEIKFQYWNPIAHLSEMRPGDGIRANHPMDIIKTPNNLVFKVINKTAGLMSKILHLYGRDLTIYATKKGTL